MVKINPYLLVLVSMFLSTPVLGQEAKSDKLILMDGSSVEGRITVQHPGRDIVFLQENKETTYPLENVLAIDRVLRSEDVISGLNDVIETRDGQVYRGQISKQLLGKSVYLTGADGEVKIIKNEDIACQRKEKVNAEQSLFEQAPYLDVVVTKDEKYQGVIVLQDYGSDKEASFLRIENSNGDLHKVEISAITEMQRILNEEYTPLKDFKVGDEELYFNRNLAALIAYTTDKNGDFKVPLGTLQVPSVGQPLVIETKDTPVNQQGILIRANVDDTKKKKALSFGYQDMVLSPIQPASTTSVKQILRKEFQVQPGYYVFFIPQDKKVYACEVK